jgi:hypothetical protein
MAFLFFLRSYHSFPAKFCLCCTIINKIFIFFLLIVCYRINFKNDFICEKRFAKAMIIALPYTTHQMSVPNLLKPFINDDPMYLYTMNGCLAHGAHMYFHSKFK